MDYNHNNNANQRITKSTVKFSARLTARIRLSETNRSLPRPFPSHPPTPQTSIPSHTSTDLQHTFFQYVPASVIAEQAQDDDLRESERTSAILKNLSKQPIPSAETRPNPHHSALSVLLSTPPIDIRHDHVPLFIDPLARYFGGSGAVSSLYDHTHFLYRKIYDNWMTHKAILCGGDLHTTPNLPNPKTFAISSQTGMFLVLLMHFFESRRLSYHRQAMPYIQVRTRLYDDIITTWCEDTRLSLASSPPSPPLRSDDLTAIPNDDDDQISISSQSDRDEDADDTDHISIYDQFDEHSNDSDESGTPSSPRPSPKPCSLQLVLIGAGFDSRAHRLPTLHDVDVFEVDQEEVLQYKQSILDVKDATPQTPQTDGSDESDVQTTKPLQTAVQPTTTTAISVSSRPNPLQPSQPSQPSPQLPPHSSSCFCSICVQQSSLHSLPFYQPLSAQTTSSRPREDQSTHMPIMWPPEQLCRRMSRVVGDVGKKQTSMQNVVGIVPNHPAWVSADMKLAHDQYVNTSPHRQSGKPPCLPVRSHLFLPIFSTNITYTTPISLVISRSNQNRLNVNARTVTSIPLLPPDAFVALLIPHVLSFMVGSRKQHRRYFLVSPVNMWKNNTIDVFNHVRSLVSYFDINPLPFLHFEPIARVYLRFDRKNQWNISPDQTTRTNGFFNSLYNIAYLVAIHLYHTHILNIPLQPTTTNPHLFIRLLAEQIHHVYIMSRPSITTPTSLQSCLPEGAKPATISLNIHFHALKQIFSTKLTTVTDSVAIFQRTNWICGLIQTGFHPVTPTLFAIEGVLMYLQMVQVKETMQLCHDLCRFNATSALISDIYSSFAHLNQDSYYALFRAGASVHDKEWLFNHHFGDKAEQHLTNHPNQHQLVESTTNQPHHSNQRKHHKTSQSTPLRSFKKGSFSNEATLMQLLDETGFDNAKIGLFKNQSYLDFRYESLLLPHNSTLSQNQQHSITPNDKTGENPTVPHNQHLATSINGNDEANFPQTNVCSCFEHTVPLCLENSITNSNTRSSLAILTPHQPNGQIQRCQLKSHPFADLDFDSTQHPDFTQSPQPSPAFSQLLAQDSTTPPPLPPSSTDSTHTNTYRFNNTICSVPVSSSYLKTAPKTNSRTIPPLCSQHYPDAKAFLAAPLFRIENYLKCKYPFPHHTFIQNHTPILEHVLNSTPNYSKPNPLNHLENIQIDNQITENGVDVVVDLISNSTTLHETIANQRPYSDPDSITDQLTVLSTGAQARSRSSPDGSPNSELTQYLHTYPPVFGITYNAFDTKSQHECEPVLRHHNAGCTSFHKAQKVAQKTIYNPFFLFKLYGLMDNKNKTFTTTNQNSRNGDGDGEGDGNAPDLFSAPNYISLLKMIATRLIDVGLDHNIQYYRANQTVVNPTTQSEVNSDDRSIPNPTSKATAGGKKEKHCTCQPCPDLVEYYVFVAKPELGGSYTP